MFICWNFALKMLLFVNILVCSNIYKLNLIVFHGKVLIVFRLAQFETSMNQLEKGSLVSVINLFYTNHKNMKQKVQSPLRLDNFIPFKS